MPALTCFASKLTRQTQQHVQAGDLAEARGQLQPLGLLRWDAKVHAGPVRAAQEPQDALQETRSEQRQGRAGGLNFAATLVTSSPLCVGVLRLEQGQQQQALQLQGTGPGGKSFIQSTSVMDVSSVEHSAIVTDSSSGQSWKSLPKRGCLILAEVFAAIQAGGPAAALRALGATHPTQLWAQPLLQGAQLREVDVPERMAPAVPRPVLGDTDTQQTESTKAWCDPSILPRQQHGIQADREVGQLREDLTRPAVAFVVLWPDEATTLRPVRAVDHPTELFAAAVHDVRQAVLRAVRDDAPPHDKLFDVPRFRPEAIVL
eukprot:CAMPEP_0175220464 /NCGR_PEP_ID=MMETSP0093-20121207/19801_1 /TAXON_ID=311494 /ORGANISM="Alexandrium monilatum, Strain CCMP3105" /LENGTH=316 /DNA_ID=CAMNT_0016513979 /DNA_START=37 /DNA_END=988 /DNA_ORIENTATION=-